MKPTGYGMSVQGRLTERLGSLVEGSMLLDQFGRCLVGGRLSHSPVVTCRMHMTAHPGSA
jgi:hypothetical protein